MHIIDDIVPSNIDEKLHSPPTWTCLMNPHINEIPNSEMLQ